MAETVAFNSLIFDNVGLLNAYKNLIQDYITVAPISDLFRHEITLLDADDDVEEQPDLPCIFIDVFQNGITNKDTQEIQNYSTFTVELDIYTSGKNKSTKNKQLCNYLIALLQSAGSVGSYFSEGLTYQTNNDLSSPADEVCRRVVRMTGMINNLTNHIK